MFLQEAQIKKSISPRSPTAIDVQIGQLIRQRRLNLNKRLEDLAAALGITPHQLQKYETGENRIAASRLIDCARALGVHVVWFYQAAQMTGQPPAPGQGGEQSLTKDEQRLLDLYRSLSVETREKLMSIASLLPSDQRKPITKARRT
jgi:transcriptional regulator with XRE-family HTH domain